MMIPSHRPVSLLSVALLVLTTGWVPAPLTVTASPVDQLVQADINPRPTSLSQLWDIVKSGFEGLLSQTNATDPGTGSSVASSAQSTAYSATPSNWMSGYSSYQGTTATVKPTVSQGTTTAAATSTAKVTYTKAVTQSTPQTTNRATTTISPTATVLFPTSTPTGTPVNVEPVGTSRSVDLTYYWAMVQTEADVGSVTLGTCDGKKLVSVTESFAKQVAIEGTAQLLDGKFINFGSCSCSNYMCFIESSYALGTKDNSLVPFSSIAVNDVTFGQTVFVPQFKGLILPNGKVHNGCLRSDDKGYGFGNSHIDWYVVAEQNYQTINGKLKLTKVDMYTQDCTIGNY
ncbi:hypothetical protein H4R33_005950 [Dimargaris cristalligena]|uniref:3D domain-containing protein n=1 Tax=Dimargaris cristalligena TaxID=215637 RepID=A0A4P9ZUC2_9FUNG|nr:hypothetical protein H4R33_005950 [Dimargaris cristalligena]RKP36382.1 hypothetical protein BJ085DRAFT_28754 [Dimargaris cristalligena]|eukprot:RKP36382.1 hypothetical protein BJ085DRAFT_28754 [Dimargaris cristalligena]